MSAVPFWLIAAASGAVYPLLLLAYLRRFSQRKALIRSLLRNDEFMDQYAKTYKTGSDLQSDEWNRRLDLDLPLYLYPIGLCTVLSVAGTAVLISADTTNLLRLPADFFTFVHRTPVGALAGFGGAYVWSLYDFTDRFRILNLPTNALHMMWFRMVLASSIGGLLPQTESPSTFTPLVAFAVATLPASAILAWLQDIGRRHLNVGPTAPDVPPMWEHIQGLTPDIIQRLQEAGVTSAAHLANQDPVSLLRRTNLEWRNVLDMMDQAFLLAYVGPSIANLRAIGIRGSIEAAVLHDRLVNPRLQTPEAESTLRAMAQVIGQEPDTTRNLLRNLWEDPQVGLLWTLWWDPTQPDAGRDSGEPPAPLRLVDDRPGT